MPETVRLSDEPFSRPPLSVPVPLSTTPPSAPTVLPGGSVAMAMSRVESPARKKEWSIRRGSVSRAVPRSYGPPGQDHWHAAAGDMFMEHIAMLESADEVATTTTWKEHVTDAELEGAVRS